MSVFTWTAVSTPSTGTDEVQALLNLPGTTIWIGVGDNGLILRSTDDGLTWVLSRTSETNNWRDIDTNGTTLTIVASNGTHRVATSTTQGATWTLQTAAEANSWQAVRWSAVLKLWVSVANSGTHRVQTSPDAVTWTFRTAASATTWSALAVNPSSGLLCAVDTNAATMTSPDGITWTGHTLSTNHTITGGGNNRGLWSTVLAAFVVPTVDNVSKRYISYSTDGATWTDALINSFGFGQVVSAPSAGGFIAPNGALLSSIGFSRDGTQVWTVEDSTFSGTWYTGNWNDATRTVLFWDNGLSFQFLRGVLPRTLTLVSPAVGAVTGAQAITLTGIGFSGATSVTFDGILATSVVVVNDTTITAVTPAHPSGLVPVVITGPGWTITGTGLYTYSLKTALIQPIPWQTPVVQAGSLMNQEWVQWFTTVKQRIEATPVISAEQIGVGAALSVGTDPNFKLTLSGTPATALLKGVTITPGFIGHLPVSRGGTGLGTVATGDLLYGSAAVTLSALAIGTTAQILEVVAGLPAWVSPAALTRVNDTNVTLTLGGSPTTALLAAASLTLGWAGLLGLARGGTNADLSATGGTSQVLRQSSAGAAVTVSQLSVSDISGSPASGTGTTNKLVKWLSGAAGTLTDSIAQESAGQIGIGGAPNDVLDVKGLARITGLTGAANYLRFDNTVNAGGKVWRVGDTGAGAAGTFQIFDQTDNKTVVHIDGSQQVGINTTSPNMASSGGYALTLDGGTAKQGYLEVGSEQADASGVVVGDIACTWTHASSDARLALFRAASSGSVANNRGGKLDLFIKGDGVGLTDVMTWFPSGGVVVGGAADPGNTNLAVAGILSAASATTTGNISCGNNLTVSGELLFGAIHGVTITYDGVTKNNDVSIGSTNAVIGFTNNGTNTGTGILTGMSGGTTGRMIVLMNRDSQGLQINFGDAGSLAANRFLSEGSSGPLTLFGGQMTIACYDNASGGWRIR